SRWGQGATAAIARATDDLRDDAEALTLLADRVYLELVRGEEGAVAFDRKALREIPRALRRRILEKAVGPIRDRSGGIDAVLLALDSESSSQRFSVASGIEISLSPTEVRLIKMGS
ncbi:MAG: hypothetical protein LC808_35400, partial [Actinobacteria bacterium]|nr:hypothetical protein [Actinomycetota bacterium]